MIKNILFPIIVSILLVLLLDPLGFMPPMYFMLVLAVVAISLGIIFVLAFKEQPRDEREERHTHFADRFAYLSGSIVLLVGLAVQGFHHGIDPWLVGALVVMILFKSFALVFKNRKN